MIPSPIAEFERFLEPAMKLLTPEAADKLLRFRFTAETQARVARLADLANEGLLTQEERSEYALFIEVADLVGIVQARARKATSHS